MKIFPTADVNFYIEKSTCNLLDGASDCRRVLEKPFRPKNMYHWRDIDGHKKTEIKAKDLYFEKYPKTRIRPQACLGMLYSTGSRFVKLSMAPPANFKCAPLPVNLQTARVVNKWLKKNRKEERLAKKKARKEAKEKEKVKKKYENRGKRRGIK